MKLVEEWMETISMTWNEIFGFLFFFYFYFYFHINCSWEIIKHSNNVLRIDFFFYHSHHVAVGLVGTMAHACLFTKRTAMSVSATKDSQEHTAKWVRAFKRGLSSISINLLVVYRESVNLIGYLTRRLSADSLQLWIANENRLFWTRDACFTPHCTCLKPLNCRCKNNKTFFRKCYFTFLCNETTSKFILKQLDYSPSFSTSDSQLGCASLTICS